MPVVIDLSAPLSVAAVDWIDDQTIEILITTAAVQIPTYWVLKTSGGIQIVNPTAETRMTLGDQVVGVAGRTFVGPVLRLVQEGVDLALPIELPRWWQGPDTAGWVDW